MSSNSNEVTKDKFASFRGNKRNLIKKGKRKESSRRWISRQLNDPYVFEAQKRGYRSRSAFKLLQINEKYKLIRSGMKILDLGCSPGGWLQVITEIINKENKGLVMGIDLLETDQLPNVHLIKGDIRDENIKNQIRTYLSDNYFDGVVSDMAADTTGHRSTDHLRTTLLLEEGFNLATQFLSEGGFFLGKCFKGGTEQNLLKSLKQKFKNVKHVKPDASRKESVETYVLAMEYKLK